MKPPRNPYDPIMEQARREAQGGGMFDISSAYGRGMRTGVGKVRRQSAEARKEALGQMTALGLSPEQQLKMQREAGRAELGAAGDIISSGTQAQAGAIFGATEGRNVLATQLAEAARGRGMQREGWEFERGMARERHGWDVQAQREAERATRRNAWLQFGGQALGGALGLAGKFF